jgi:hypothetical protein
MKSEQSWGGGCGGGESWDDPLKKKNQHQADIPDLLFNDLPLDTVAI